MYATYLLFEPVPWDGWDHISFNGKFRDECLNEHWFVTMAHARAVIEDWRIEYNTERPHSSLRNRTPQEYAAVAVEGYR